MRATLAALLLLPVVGCTHLALRDNTIKTAGTTTDIYYSQILNNVAMFHANPEAIPAFSSVTSGTVTVTDQKSLSAGGNYAPTVSAMDEAAAIGVPTLQLLPTASKERQVTDNWTLLPVSDPDNLTRLRCAFRLAVLDASCAECDAETDLCRQQLKQFFLCEDKDLPRFVPTGWYRVGRKRDVPKDACYVGSWCDVYVWVPREGLSGLTRFTFTVLDIATGELHRPQKTVVKKYKGEEKPENLEGVEVTTTGIDREALEGIRRNLTIQSDRERSTDNPDTRSGLFFVPGN